MEKPKGGACDPEVGPDDEAKPDRVKRGKPAPTGFVILRFLDGKWFQRSNAIGVPPGALARERPQAFKSQRSSCWAVAAPETGSMIDCVPIGETIFPAAKKRKPKTQGRIWEVGIWGVRLYDVPSSKRTVVVKLNTCCLSDQN